MSVGFFFLIEQKNVLAYVTKSLPQTTVYSPPESIVGYDFIHTEDPNEFTQHFVDM